MKSIVATLITTIPLISLFALLTCLGCQLEDPRVGIVVSEVIEISTDQSEAFANGGDRIVVTAELRDQANANLPITFLTDQGSFVGTGSGSKDQITVTASPRIAQATLITNTTVEPEVQISASVTGTENNVNTTFTAPTTVAFLRSYPDLLDLKTSDRFPPATQGTDYAVTATLSRRDGANVSAGTTLLFEVSPVDTSMVNAIVIERVQATAETATTTITLLEGIPGSLHVIATVENEAGSVVASDTLLMEFQ